MLLMEHLHLHEIRFMRDFGSCESTSLSSQVLQVRFQIIHIRPTLKGRLISIFTREILS